MLMRTDPFREFDRVAQQVFGTHARPAAMPIDAFRQGDEFVVQFDLPGVDPECIDLTVERNVLTVHAERRRSNGDDVELLIGERPGHLQPPAVPGRDARQRALERRLHRRRPHVARPGAGAGQAPPGHDQLGPRLVGHRRPEHRGGARARRCVVLMNDPGRAVPAATRPLGGRPFPDENVPLFTVGQVAEMLAVQPAFLRRLDAMEVVRP